MRILHVDGDGKDDLVPKMHAISGDGELLYNLGDQGITHGDHFHISDLDPTRPGLEAYAIQQNNPIVLVEYYYDPKTGAILWRNNIGKTVDAARGMAADADPRHPGFEVWSFYGIHTARGTKITDEPTRPWPNLQIWWDGDALGENLNETKVEKWNPTNQTSSRLLTASALVPRTVHVTPRHFMVTLSVTGARKSSLEKVTILSYKSLRRPLPPASGVLTMVAQQEP